MVDVLVLSEESHTTFIALEDFLFQMTLLMLIPVAFGEEFLTTELTIELFVANMDLHVLDHTTFVFEGLSTRLKSASKGCLAYVFLYVLTGILSRC